MFNMIPFRSNNPIANRENRYFNPFADDFFRSFFGDDFANGMMTAERPMKVDVRDEGDHYLLEADMPGVKKEDLRVEVEDGVLTIAAEYDERNETKEDGRYICRERRCGRTSRAFNVDGIREEEIRAAFENGVLKLTLPKQNADEKPKTRAIEIQ